MLDFLRKIKKPKYETLNRIEIDKNNLIYNYNYLKSLQPNSEIWPVLKSNAYGHGLKQVCQILNETGCPKIVVDSFPEAQIAYKYFKKKVLLLGEAAVDSYKYCNFKKTEFIVYNLETISKLVDLDKETKIHIFVNTGMNREGVSLENIDKVITAVKKHKNIQVIGLCSHLASADEISDLNEKQIENFLLFLEKLKKEGIDPEYKHLCNSAGIFISKNNIFNSFRVGLSFYGYNPLKAEHPLFETAKKLKPAFDVFSKITSVQNTKKGDKVSYNETFESDEDTRIATIPFGYYEGLDRRYSNKISFQIRQKEAVLTTRIAGRVCMNLTSLDCQKKSIQTGDMVNIISSNTKAPNSIQNIASEIKTIPYEILVGFKENIRRKIV